MRHRDAMDAEEAYMRPTPRFAFRKALEALRHRLRRTFQTVF